MARTVTLELVGSVEEWARSISEEQLPSAILALLRAQLDVGTSRTPFDSAVALFHENLKSIPDAFEFEVPQVVGTAGWEQLDRSSRLALGKYIKANQAAFGVTFVRTTVSRHAVYKKA